MLHLKGWPLKLMLSIRRRRTRSTAVFIILIFAAAVSSLLLVSYINLVDRHIMYARGDITEIIATSKRVTLLNAPYAKGNSAVTKKELKKQVRKPSVEQGVRYEFSPDDRPEVDRKQNRRHSSQIAEQENVGKTNRDDFTERIGRRHNTMQEGYVHKIKDGSYKRGKSNKFPLQSPRSALASPVTPNTTPQVSERNIISDCPRLSISDNNKQPYGKCKPHQPSQRSCKYAEQIYKINSQLLTCKTPSKGNICSVTANSDSFIKVYCDGKLCLEDKILSIHALAIDPEDGELVIVKSFSTVKKLRDGLPQIIRTCVKLRFPFVFLKCRSRSNGSGNMVTQLLPVPAILMVTKLPSYNLMFGLRSRSIYALNVNILLLDSISRAHFYRSLPRTIELFKKWSSTPSVAPAEVFDFELFQAVEGHTAENTHAMFTGKLLPPHDEEENIPVEMEYLFGHFARKGYQTAWQEDLCWKGVWGLMADLDTYDWESLQSELHRNHIHQTGLTHSSCEILSKYNVSSPFAGTPGDQLCYNGQFQHTYLLNYTLDMIQAVNANRQVLPLLSYMSLSVGHDDVGRRIQTLDPSLVEYLKAVSTAEQTITIVLADHGNTYTAYSYNDMEGRFEMFHPSLFIIVPNNAARVLGDQAVSALRANQRRLVTAVDLHSTLMALAGPLKDGVLKVGLFDHIPDTRTCHDVELRTPNLCVCEGWDSQTTNDTSKIALVEFAIGVLNRKIDYQITEKKLSDQRTLSLRRSCRRLMPLSFQNVRERNSKNGTLITSIDVYVASDGRQVNPQAIDVFRVEMESLISPESDSLELKLLSFERGSLFAKYERCADPGVSLKLCICSQGSSLEIKYSSSSSSDEDRSTFSSFKSLPQFEKLNDSNCVYLIKRNHSGESFAYEILNRCTDRKVVVMFDVEESDNVKFSRNVPFVLTVSPGSVVFGLSVMKDVSGFSCTIGVAVTIIKELHFLQEFPNYKS